MGEETQENKAYTYWQIARFAGLHLVCLIAVYIIYALLSSHPLVPWPESFYRSDVQFYAEIKNFGYNYVDYDGRNIAFFPGFPYLWKLTGLDIYGIVVLNVLLFYTGFIILARQFGFSLKEMLLFLSFPSLCFIYVPYSEALFFLVSVLLLAGLLKRNTAMIIAGLFLCSVCRSAANIFLPAIIITELLTANNPHRLRNILLYALAALAGVFIVMCIQHAQTGEWIGFIKTQRNWGVWLRWPTLPFHTWGGKDHLDGGALLAGTAAGIGIVYYLIRWLKKDQNEENKAYIFSLLFVVGLTLFTVAFKGGNLYSLNRYFIPTAFFAVAFSFGLRQLSFTIKQAGIAALCVFACWLLMGSYVHIRALAGYFIFTLYISLYFLLQNKNTLAGSAAFYILYILNILVQVDYFVQFTDGKWIG